MNYSGINLLPASQWRHSWLAYIFRWTITYGRYVLIFTELIVILAFLSRFKLDQDLSDLNDKIKTDKIILQSARGFEKQVQQTVHDQNLIIKEWKKQLRWSSYLQIISRFTPQSILLKKLEASPSQINLVGISTNLNELNIFLNNLKASPAFKNVSLDKIHTSLNSSQGGVTTFTISLTPNYSYVKYQD